MTNNGAAYSVHRWSTDGLLVLDVRGRIRPYGPPRIPPPPQPPATWPRDTLVTTTGPDGREGRARVLYVSERGPRVAVLVHWIDRNGHGRQLSAPEVRLLDLAACAAADERSLERSPHLIPPPLPPFRRRFTVERRSR